MDKKLKWEENNPFQIYNKYNFLFNIVIPILPVCALFYKTFFSSLIHHDTSVFCYLLLISGCNTHLRFGGTCVDLRANCPGGSEEFPSYSNYLGCNRVDRKCCGATQGNKTRVLSGCSVQLLQNNKLWMCWPECTEFSNEGGGFHTCIHVVVTIACIYDVCHKWLCYCRSKKIRRDYF